jgi:pimeloyl-ACP methyl ester carboxylesterase
MVKVLDSCSSFIFCCAFTSTRGSDRSSTTRTRERGGLGGGALSSPRSAATMGGARSRMSAALYWQNAESVAGSAENSRARRTGRGCLSAIAGAVAVQGTERKGVGLRCAGGVGLARGLPGLLSSAGAWARRPVIRCGRRSVPGAYPLRQSRERRTGALPWLPVSWLARDRFESVNYAPRVSCPTLALIAGSDEVIARRHARALVAAFRPGGISAIEVPGAGHNDIQLWPQYGATIGRFLNPGCDGALLLTGTSSIVTLLSLRVSSRPHLRCCADRSAP